MPRPSNPFALSMSGWLLMVDASTVISLRMARLAQMDAAALAESQRMISEKMLSMSLLMMKAWTGGLGQSPVTAVSRTIAHFRPDVARNRRRLIAKRPSA